jgi:hypothetical protein
LNPALSVVKESTGWAFRGFFFKERVKSSGFKSNRELGTRSCLNRIDLEEIKGSSLPSLVNFHAQSTKALISKPISRMTGNPQKSDRSDQRYQETVTDYLSREKITKDYLQASLPTPSKSGFRGYKFSILNKNRNLVKSKTLRRLG